MKLSKDLLLVIVCVFTIITNIGTILYLDGVRSDLIDVCESITVIGQSGDINDNQSA